MFKPCEQKIEKTGFVYAHTGLKPDGENSIYAVAAVALDPDGTRKEFSSLVRYAGLTAREYHYSGVTRKKLMEAPPSKEVSADLKKILKDRDVVFILDDHDILDELKKFCGASRIVDLCFAAEFFLPGIKTPSFRNLWPLLFEKQRDRLSYTPEEAVELSEKLVRHICGTVLNDRHTRHAPVLRWFLNRSDTLFGQAFLQINRRFQEYFGGLFDPGAATDTKAWKMLLERAPKPDRIPPERRPFEPVPCESLEPLYQGMASANREFRLRPEQVDYARNIVGALNDQAVLTIEAGTGTGKTQGYLIPVLEFLRRNPERRAAISTYTKSLQEQIFHQEIGWTRTALPIYQDIQTALLKGKSSYLCAEKLDNIYDDKMSGAKLLAWLYCLNIIFRFRVADVDTVGEKVRQYLDRKWYLTRILREVSAGTGCTPRHVRCPAQVVTALAQSARLVITNHHKLALLDRDPLLTGLFTNYVIDEANHFETAVRNAFGTEVVSRDIRADLDYLEACTRRILVYAAGEHRGEMERSLREAAEIQAEMDELLNILKDVHPQVGSGFQALPYDHPLFRDGHIQPHLETMRKRLGEMVRAFALVRDEDACRLLKIQTRTSRRMETVLGQLNDYIEALRVLEENIHLPNNVTACQVFQKNWTLAAQWVQVDLLIRDQIYMNKDAVIYTAATLCHRNRFDSFSQITGLHMPLVAEEGGAAKPFRFARIPSPFLRDLEIIVPETAVSGKFANKELWLKAVVESLPRLIMENRGRTLVLFSSYQDLNLVLDQVRNAINGTRYPLLVQKPGLPAAPLCDEFRAIRESVLFGVDTFWYGVDFKGDTLTQVIITRIPYPPPSDPLQMARKKIMSSNLFWDRYNYDTEIKMRQGIGRLIRCDTDRGRVVILDSRYRP